MESLTHMSTATHLSLRIPVYNQNSFLKLSYALSPSSLFCSIWLRRRSFPLIVEAKKNRKGNKEDRHSFVVKPDEATGLYPEAVLLKEKKVQEDGRMLPEFADAEEKELYEFLDLQLQSELNVERMRHYEVVYLIHEKHAEEVENVNEKIQDFLREKKAKIWRVNDWGVRRLAYKIQKANYAHYMLMNFELEASWINDFKTLLDKDERVIRHLVIKRDEAITEDCPPPPDFNPLRASIDDEEEDDIDYDDEDEEEEEEEDFDGDEEEEVVAYVEDEDKGDKDNLPTHASKTSRESLKALSVGR